uniref:AAA domain-containing protein n=1 Tax=Candidatus Kentrum sp. SD TaxID=2126332 RepID=A0A450YDM9_9GAMM|nr:MAG: AAA domain-containing protein [Candidatus Kentron sp. SD]VFK44460.1 MAG: AAA domain-containing protein [Candidatus Kentron sp. SD]VFK80928.1 MAG: AAA domain-containing protein [Candidatus Kentron sp. SD]
MTDMEEELEKMFDEAVSREKKQEKESSELFSKVFNKDASGEFSIDEGLRDAILAEEKSVEVLEELIEKAKADKKTREEADSTKLRARLLKTLQELLDQKRTNNFDEEIEKYQQEKESSREDKASFQYFDCSQESIKPEDLKGDPVLFKPNFLTAGEIHILAGKAGCGKSYLATQLALSLARGDDLLGMKSTKKGRIAYLSFEDSNARLLQRLVDIGKKKDELIDLKLYTDLSPLIISLGSKIEITKVGKDIVKSIQKQEPDTIIIDTYSQAFLHEDGDNRGSQSVGNWLRKEFKDKTVIITHHVRKAEEWKKLDDITLDAVRGASALVGYSRSVFLLGSIDGQQVFKTLKSNYGEPFPDYQNGMDLEKIIEWAEDKKIFRGFKKREDCFDPETDNNKGMTRAERDFQI